MLVATIEKGNEIIIQIKKKNAAVFINIANSGFTHKNLIRGQNAKVS